MLHPSVNKNLLSDPQCALSWRERDGFLGGPGRERVPGTVEVLILFLCNPFRLSLMPMCAGGRCELCGHFTWQLQVGHYPSQSLHYGSANNTTDKAGMLLPASLQVIIHLGKLPFVLLRDDSGRASAGGCGEAGLETDRFPGGLAGRGTAGPAWRSRGQAVEGQACVLSSPGLPFLTDQVKAVVSRGKESGLVGGLARSSFSLAGLSTKVGRAR